MIHRLLRRFAKALGYGLGKLSRFRLARIVFFYAARDYTPAVLVEGKIDYLVGSGDYVGENVLFSGGFDQDVIARIFEHLAAVGYSDFTGKNFVDIGANIGTTCIPRVASGQFARGVAIEPGPLNFKLLSANVHLNNLGERFTVIQTALTDSPRTLAFELNDDNFGDHRVRKDGFEAKGKMVRVAGTTLDQIVREGRLRLADVGLFWIDTQGHEASVLAGAEVFRGSPVPVVMEYWPTELTANGTRAELHDRLKAYFTHFVDLRLAETIVRPIADVDALSADVLTDLLLLNR